MLKVTYKVTVCWLTDGWSVIGHKRVSERCYLDTEFVNIRVSESVSKTTINCPLELISNALNLFSK